jgi:hypothetical protein
MATKVAGSAPTAAGGTIADGTYSLTALTAYTGVGGPTGTFGPSTSVFLTISGSTMQQVGHINGQERRYTTTIMTSGTSLSTMDTCPTPKGATHSYTATALALRIYDSTGGLSVEQTYSKH